MHRYLSAAAAEDLLNRTVGRSDLLADFKPYLIGRMNEGCTHAGRLHEELQALGWRGSVQTVRRFTYPARAMAQIPATAPAPAPAPPKARHITRWILTDPKHLDEPDSVALKKARSRCDHLDTVAKRVGEFAVMMRDLTGEDLPAWLDRVQDDDLPALRSLITGLRRDLDAVTNGLTMPHNSGAVEGAVNRVKMLKRRCYGRAGFPLLRARILHTP